MATKGVTDGDDKEKGAEVVVVVSKERWDTEVFAV